LNLVVDIGNTLTKIAVFKDDDLFDLTIKPSENIEEVSKSLRQMITKQPVQNAIVSSVGYAFDDFFKTLTDQIQTNISFDHLTKIPIKNKYRTPETLGKDRLAAMVAANHLFKNKNVLVFDAGTALTVDFINAKGEYRGGNISPGLEMRFNALNHFTKKLPLIETDQEFAKAMGENTREAILCGVQNGIVDEINAYIYRFKKKYPNLKIIFTGGDTFFFEKRIKNKIFADQNLVLKGLNIILNYNE
jgi:type III pantothenate kinase